jgi:hypothetical protein
VDHRQHRLTLFLGTSRIDWCQGFTINWDVDVD